MHGTVILREVGQGFDPINYGLVTSMLLFLLFIRSSVLQIIFDALLQIIQTAFSVVFIYWPVT